MFIRPCYRKKNGKRHAYWALVESYRTERGPRQRVVSYLGQLDERGRLGVKYAVGGSGRTYQKSLFTDIEPEWVEVDLKRVRVERCADFGGPWLGLELLKELGLDSLFKGVMPAGREDVQWSLMSMVLVISRLCDPSSELHIAEHFYEHTSLSDLLGIPAEKINDDRLYRALDRLLPHKETLQVHLKNRLGELFDLEYDLLLYDITSTYFEGQCNGNPLARRGYSRDHRGDCKQVCIGLVVSKCGMPLGYEIFAGNRADVTTVEDWDTVHKGLEVKLCPSPNGEETFILCRSADRRQKEKAMHERFEKRIEDGLRKIEESCRKRKYKPVTIAKRLGKLLGRNSRSAGLFQTDVIVGVDGRAKLLWSKTQAWRNWADLSEGCYLLRSNVNDWDARELWKAYIQLTEAEAAFRIHKSDLKIRPIWHQKAERVEAHILVCFLAYVLWKTLGQMCSLGGLGDEPRRVLEEIARIKAVDVVLPTKTGREIRRRCVSRPTDHQAILLHHLGLTLPSNLPLIDKKLKGM